MTPIIRVLLAEDHALVAEGLKLLLANVPEVSWVGHARTGFEAMSILEKREADIVMLDVDMPGLNGLDTCLEISRRFPQVKVIALTMHNQPSIIRQMLRNGALGYVLKDAQKEELVEALHTVMRGEHFLSYKASRSLLDELRQPSRADEIAFIPELTNREKEVLALIVRGRTTQEISGQLFISAHTAETHRRNLLAKIGARNTADLVRIALEKGLV
jgi:DNA-binding NarL/FixJ family response regulator